MPKCKICKETEANFGIENGNILYCYKCYNIITLITICYIVISVLLQ